MRPSPRSAPRLLTLLLALLPALAWSQVLRFTTLDIGQGDSAVLVAPGGCVALFDGGPTGSGTVIKAYLKSLGITHIDMAFVSHMHTDHIGGIDEVDTGTDAVSIAAVYDHGGTYDSTVYTSYVNHFSGRRFTVTRGQTFSLCNQVTLKVLAVGGNGISSSDENSKSVAVKITYGAFDALVGGDLTAVPDIESTIRLDVGELELYKVHHHGSRTSSGDAFLGTINPLVSFISVGKDNTYGHPTQECLSRLTAHGSSIWQTEDPATNKVRGHIQLTTTDGNTFQVTQGTQSVSYTSKGVSTGPDVTSPSQPGSLVASAASPSEVDLTWLASTDNVAVTGYRVYRATSSSNFTLAGSSSTTGFADLGLNPGVSYTYQVTSFDAANNESTPATVSVRTPAPRITVTSPNGGESWSASSVHNVTWTSMGVSLVKVEYSLNGSTWNLIATNQSSPGSTAWTLPGTLTSSARVRVTSLSSTLTDSSDAPFTITAAPPPTPARVFLNEILANEPGTSPDGEFVELVNGGGTAADLSGWTISDADQVRHTFASGTTLAPGKAIVVYGGVKGIPAGTPNVVVASTGTLSLNNGGDTVTVKNPSGTSVDGFTYGSALASQDGVSMNRSPDVSPTGTFVLHNTLSSSSASPGFRVNGGTF